MNKFLICMMFVPVIISCIDEIRLKVDDVEERLVIEGLIADTLDTYTVRVKVARNKGLYPVSEALVRVIDNDHRVYLFYENADDPGTYESLLRGEANREYYLEVKTPDHKTIRSKPAKLMPAPRMENPAHSIGLRVYIDSEGRQVEEKTVMLTAAVRFRENERKPFLRWRTSGEYEFHEPSLVVSKWCYVKQTADLNQLTMYNPRFLHGNILEHQDVHFTILDFRFAFMYCFHVSMYAMPEEEYTYWRSIRDLLENDGTLYDPPPGNVKGNLYEVENENEQIIGYFSVSGVSRLRYFVAPQDLRGNNVNPPCSYSNRDHPSCRDCLILKNSSLDRPVYWP